MHQVNSTWRYEVGDKFLMVPVADMSSLEVFCKHCKTGIVFSLAEPPHGLPYQCPVCSDRLDRDLVELITTYGRLFRSFSHADAPKASFRISENKT